MIKFAGFFLAYFNIMCRLFGIFLSGSGVLFAGFALYNLVPHAQGDTIWGSGNTTQDLLTATIALAIGMAFLFARPWTDIFNLFEEPPGDTPIRRRNLLTGL